MRHGDVQHVQSLVGCAQGTLGVGVYIHTWVSSKPPSRSGTACASTDLSQLLSLPGPLGTRNTLVKDPSFPAIVPLPLSVKLVL